MDLAFNQHGCVHIRLSRRNLEDLLTKLDTHSNVTTLERLTGDWHIAVTAQENEEHYGIRMPGQITTEERPV